MRAYSTRPLHARALSSYNVLSLCHKYCRSKNLVSGQLLSSYKNLEYMYFFSL